MKKNNKPVILWLLSGCVLLFIMVMVGGITRLTNSGLSMTDWHLVTDTFPPTTDEAWNTAFEEYKKFPEYQKINQFKTGGFTIEDYKFIYFWEWFHRFIGRIIGLVFIIPFIYFWAKGYLNPTTLKKCFILLFMGGFQGFLGWFMVKSGLIDHPDVSHFRLALHLTFAFITFAYTLWVALDLIYEDKNTRHPQLRKIAWVGMILLIMQIIWGGFVAGLDAGRIHNHWPLMSEGKLIHETVWIEEPTIWGNITEGKSGVQFFHRTMAYFVVGWLVFLFFKTRQLSHERIHLNATKVLVWIVFLQFILGVLTLLFHVPLSLGLLHQLMAFFLLSSMTFTLHRMSK